MAAIFRGNMFKRPLQSIRGRILTCFVLFGTSLSLLVICAVKISSGLISGVFMFSLLALLVFVIAWHVSTYLTHDVRKLAQRVTDVDPSEPGAVLQLKKPFPATTLETAELSDALRRFGGRIEVLTNNYEEEVERCKRETEEATGTLSDFMYYIAHTLRTPLNGIRWSVESLKNEDAGSVNEEQREILDKLEYSTVRLAAVASELQDALIVLRGEPLHMRLSDGDLLALIDEAAGHWAVAVRRKGLTLDWKHPTGKKKFHGDPERISQVLNILLDNAVKYSNGTGKTITLRVLFVDGTETAADRRTWKLPPTIEDVAVVMVRDEGIGIGAEEREKLFHAFFRGAAARGMWVDGKGIGLTIVKAVAQGMGGDVWFTSVKNKGTAMYVAIPLA